MTIETHELSSKDLAPLPSTIGGSKALGFELRRHESGLSTNVDRVTLNCGEKSIDVLPTRGMGVWQAFNQGVRFGWDSPIAGPVHPLWVPLSEPGGLGWLEGFDEMMVRCGLASNGAPEFDTNGQLIFPLHGRIANLPASDLRVEIDDSAGQIGIRGIVDENRFHFQRLQLETEISLQLDSDEISIVDRVTNLSNRPASFQMLYHNNFGSPILEEGSQLFAPIKTLVPRNYHAAAGIAEWNQFAGPDATYAEQVYFAELHAGPDNHSLVVLANANQTQAASIRFDTTQLPCFSIWKNTVGQADGYVAGLEPGTNFPNPRSFEESQGRVVNLPPGDSCILSLKIGMLVGSHRVESAIQDVDSLAGEMDIADGPTAGWCS